MSYDALQEVVFSDRFSDRFGGSGTDEPGAEKLYYMSLSIAKSMLEKDVIDQEMLAVINEKLLEKYHPVMGMLLAGRDTACRSAEAGAEV